jgi:membrane dipeptidase
MMLVVDAHLDHAWNALQWNRNILESVYTIRIHEKSEHGKGRAQNTVALPEMRKGNVALCFATVLARSTGRAVPHVDYASQVQCEAIAKGQLAYYEVLERDGHIRIIRDRLQLDRQMLAWETWDDLGAPPDEVPTLGFVISMEGADPIQHPSQLPLWWEAGLRVLGPTHYGSGRYAGGTGTELGLTELGVGLLDAMDGLGMILDLSHLSDQAFWASLKRFRGPVLASHNNCRALVPHQRQYSDDQLQEIMKRGGVIGVAFDAWMLLPGWIEGVSTNASVTLENVVDHIDHICQLAGNTRHAAIGSDLDGGFGREQSPRDIDTISDVQHLALLLRTRGYGDEDIAAIMNGNWLRLLRESWDA